MVCYYCGGATQVVNSRHQKRANRVWRRRSCLVCGSTVTTLESLDYTASLSLRTDLGALQPFSRDKLFVSILSSLQYRKTAIADATELTDTILARLSSCMNDAGQIERLALIKLVATTLERFDGPAGVQYSAYHPR